MATKVISAKYQNMKSAGNATNFALTLLLVKERMAA